MNNNIEYDSQKELFKGNGLVQSKQKLSELHKTSKLNITSCFTFLT